MTVNVTGNLSAIAAGGVISKFGTDVVEILDDADFQNASVVDASLRTRKITFRGSVVGASDANGVTDSLLVYCYSPITGWSLFSTVGEPSSAVRFLGATPTIIRNTTFKFTGTVASIHGGSVFGDLNDGGGVGTFNLYNVNLLAPNAFASANTDIIFNSDEIESLFIRNITFIVFTKSPLVSRGIKIVNSPWGLTIDGTYGVTPLFFSGIQTENCLVQTNGVVVLTDCQISNRFRFRRDNSNASVAGFKLRKTFKIALNGNNNNVKVSGYDKNNNNFFSITTDTLGIASEQLIEYASFTRASTGRTDSTNLNNTTNFETYATLQATPSKYATNLLPLHFLFYSYTAKKQYTQITSIDITTDANLLPITFQNIIEIDPAVTGTEAETNTLTDIDTLQKLVNRAKAWNVASSANARYPSYSTSLLNVNGDVVDLGVLTLVIDATASTAFTVNTDTNTVTIKASNLIASTGLIKLKTTGTISTTNGASITVPYQDSNGLRFRFYGLPDSGTARIRIEKVSTGTFQYATANSSGECFLFLEPNTEYLLRADDYLYYRLQDLSFSTANMSQLQVSLEPVKDSNGDIITSLSPVTGEVNCLSFDFEDIVIIVSYDEDHPIISLDSLIYAIEKYQSGLNANITGSTDTGLALDTPLRFENGVINFANDTTVKVKAADSNLATELPYIRATIKHQGYEDISRLLDYSNGRALLFPIGQVIAVSGGGGSGGGASAAEVWANATRTLTALPGTIAADVTAIKAVTDSLAIPTASQNASAVRTNLATELGRIDQSISTNNSAIAAIQEKTDNLPTSPSSSTDVSNVVASIFNYTVDTNFSFKMMIRLMTYVLGSRLTNSGNTATFRDLNNTKNAVTASVTQEGDRTSISYNLDD
jgi:hypothetical protein